MKTLLCLTFLVFLINPLIDKDNASAQSSTNAPRKSYNTDLYWSVFTGAGFSFFPFDDNSQIKRFGGTFSLGTDVTYFWNTNWGISTGLTFDYGLNRLKINDLLVDDFSTMDGNEYGGAAHDPFYLHSEFNKYKEMQYTHRFGIPLEVKYRHAFNSKDGLLVGMGPKFYTTGSNHMEVKRGSYTTSAHYPQYGTDLIIDHGPGFETFTPGDEQSLSTGSGVGAIANVYATRVLNSYLTLYYGVNLEYFPKRSTHLDHPFVTYTATSPSEAETAYKTDNLDDNSRINAGLRVGLMINQGMKKRHDYLKQLQKDAIKRQHRLAEEEAIRKINQDRLEQLDLLATMIYVTQQDSNANKDLNANRFKAIAAISDSITNDRLRYDNVIAELLLEKYNENEQKQDRFEGLNDEINRDRRKLDKNDVPTFDRQYLSNEDKVREMVSLNHELHMNNIAYANLPLTPYAKPIDTKSLEKVLVDVQNKMMADQLIYSANQQYIADQLAQIEAENRALARADSILSSGSEPTSVVIQVRTTVFKESDLEIIKQPIQFEFGNARITPETRKNLENLGAVLHQYPNLKMTIIGHTDIKGNDDFNLWLGQLRADVIRDSFVKKGMDGDLIETSSKGKSSPLVPNDTDANRQVNRRVDIIIESVGNLTN